MRFQRRSGPDEPEINLVPLIDILLVLLIFLTATTTFTRLSSLAVELPASASPSAVLTQELAVEIDATGQVAIQGRPVAGSAVPLEQHLRQAASTLGDANENQPPLVVIYADAQASHQAVIDVMQAAARAGLERLSFAARQPAP